METADEDLEFRPCFVQVCQTECQSPGPVSPQLRHAGDQDPVMGSLCHGWPGKWPEDQRTLQQGHAEQEPEVGTGYPGWGRGLSECGTS